MANERTPLYAHRLFRENVDDSGEQIYTKSDSFYQVKPKRKQRLPVELEFSLNNGIILPQTKIPGKFGEKKIPFLLQCALVVACILAIILSIGFGYSLSVLYAELIREFNADRTLVAFNQSIYEALLAVGGALWSYPVSKLGYGYSIMIGGFLGSFSMAICSLAKNVPTVIVLVGFISGASFGVVYMGPFIVAGDISKRYKAAVIGFVSIGSSFGQFAMPYAMERCISEYGWEGALLVLGALCLNAVPCGLIMLVVHRARGAEGDSAQSASAKRSLFKSSLFNSKMFWLLMLNSIILAFTILAESRFLVDLAELRGYTRTEGSFLIQMIGVGNLVGGLMGVASKIVCRLSSAAHMSYCILVVAASHVMVVYFDTYSGLIGAAFVNGVGVGNIIAHVAVVMFEIYGIEDFAPSFASWNIMKGVGNLMGGSLGGVIQDTTGSYDLLFQISAILSVFYSFSFAGICVYRWRRSRTYKLIM
ncbi:monocarboxylate transporter 4-like [Mya arenaria]|uniref:monocarboxylate transporter 4-like n=1 Tax=Mya arenaria TaxID=6604 RepID=UPI0022E38ADE|nr:monocarboxylate transporter 4-like [Mya arenaria]